MQTTFARWNKRVQRSLLAALVLVALAAPGLASAGASAAPPSVSPADPATGTNTLTGHVLLPGGPAAIGAGIAARQDGSHAGTTVDGAGACSPPLGAGT